ALAELGVPRLEFLGGLLVLHEGGHAAANPVHLLEIRYLSKIGGLRRLLGRCGGSALLARHDGVELAEDGGPAVTDEVFADRDARDHVVEVLPPPSLPPRCLGELLPPLRVGGPVAP